ncbi:MAG TPA: cytochrome P450 [Acidimicrobiales bacterium]|nr:cytochrome P450 [Acidimicrobiales bacterium]
MSTISSEAINLTDPAFWMQPLERRQAGFAALRRERPLGFFEEPAFGGIPLGPGYYAVTKHTDVLEVSRNPEIFCSGLGSTSVTDMPAEAGEFFGSFIVMDDPRHARLRGIVARRFTPKQLQGVMDNVLTVADEVIDAMAQKGETDFVADISAPFPLLIIMDMMGIPRSEYRTVLDSTNKILGAGDKEFFDGAADEEMFGQVIGAGMTLVQLMNDVAEFKRSNPGDDLTTALINADLEDDILTPQELGSFFILLAVAGNDTTRTALSHGMHYLTQNPDQRRIWQDNLDEVTPTAVEEIVRYAGPVVYMRRTLTRDHALSGTELKQGDKVVMFYGSASRDEDVFDDPDRFDVRRNPNPHVGFGGPGPHFCLGAHLARRELNVMFRRLFERLPDIEATGLPELLSPAGMPLVTGVKRLPVRFTPAPVS